MEERKTLPCLFSHHMPVHFLEGLAGALTGPCFPAGCRLCDPPLTDALRLRSAITAVLCFRKSLREVATSAGRREHSLLDFRRLFRTARTATSTDLLFSLHAARVCMKEPWRRGRVDNLRILLLDDVMTTGATLDAWSRALCKAGAKSAAGLSIARAGRPLSSFADHP